MRHNHPAPSAIPDPFAEVPADLEVLTALRDATPEQTAAANVLRRRRYRRYAERQLGRALRPGEYRRLSIRLSDGAIIGAIGSTRTDHRPRERRAAPARRPGASSATSGSDPGDPDEEEEPPAPARLTLAPRPKAIYAYGLLSAADRGADAEPLTVEQFEEAFERYLTRCEEVAS